MAKVADGLEGVDAWYVSGANIGERCENLLASNKWQYSNPETYKGLVNRLELMTNSGLPKMRVIPLSTIETLGRIPRSNEGYAVDALEAVVKAGLEKDVLWGSDERIAAEAAGHVVGDVDDKDHTKALSLIGITNILF